MLAAAALLAGRAERDDFAADFVDHGLEADGSAHAGRAADIVAAAVTVDRQAIILRQERDARTGLRGFDCAAEGRRQRAQAFLDRKAAFLEKVAEPALAFDLLEEQLDIGVKVFADLEQARRGRIDGGCDFCFQRGDIAHAWCSIQCFATSMRLANQTPSWDLAYLMKS